MPCGESGLDFGGGEVEKGGGTGGQEAGGDVVEGFVDEGHPVAYFGGGNEEEGGETGDELIDSYVREGVGEGGEGLSEDSARVPELGMLLGGANEVTDAVFGEASFLFPKEGEGLGR